MSVFLPSENNCSKLAGLTLTQGWGLTPHLDRYTEGNAIVYFPILNILVPHVGHMLLTSASIPFDYILVYFNAEAWFIQRCEIPLFWS